MAYTDLNCKFKKIGKNVEIGRNVYFRYPDLIEIGDNVIIDDFCYFTAALQIESFIHIGPHCSIIGGKLGKLIMENFSGLSAGCRIICSSDDYLGSGLTNPTIPEKYHAEVKHTTIIIQKHAVLGTNTIVHPGITIGEGSAIGSGSLVTKNTEPWSVYRGVPAIKVKERDKDKILQNEFQFLKDYHK